MRRLLFLLCGLFALGAITWAALAYQPFEALPPPPTATLRPRRTGTPRPVARRDIVDPRLLRYSVETRRTPPLSATHNILVAGLDSRRGLARKGRAASRTDALMLLVFDRRSDHVGWVSLHRDFLVNLPGRDHARLNVAYRHGVSQGGPKEGARLLRSSVEQLLALPVAHLVFIDQAGFEEAIDDLGGVQVEVVCPIRDRFIDARGEGGRLTLDVPAGLQTMDGKTALMFARSRHGRSVVDRNRRQQAVAMGLVRRLQRLSPTAMRALLPKLRRAIFTEMSTLELLRFATRLARTKRAHLHGLVLGGRQGTPTTLADGRWVMLPDSEKIAKALGGLFSRKAPGFRKMVRPCPPADAALRRPR